MLTSVISKYIWRKYICFKWSFSLITAYVHSLSRSENQYGFCVNLYWPIFLLNILIWNWLDSDVHSITLFQNSSLLSILTSMSRDVLCVLYIPLLMERKIVPKWEICRICFIRQLHWFPLNNFFVEHCTVFTIDNSSAGVSSWNLLLILTVTFHPFTWLYKSVIFHNGTTGPGLSWGCHYITKRYLTY